MTQSVHLFEPTRNHKLQVVTDSEDWLPWDRGGRRHKAWPAPQHRSCSQAASLTLVYVEPVSDARIASKALLYHTYVRHT